MTRWMLMLAVVVLLLLSAGCGRRPSYGFSLPPGDVHAGQVAFTDLGCASCHQVKGVNLPAPTKTPAVELGGEVRVVPTAGELTSEISCPARSITAGFPKQETVGARSAMPDLTERMTVRQMADLIAFLRAHYELSPSLPSGA
ncbi:MAG: c-type cytochrome [Vicinamibacterales bacterium]